MSEFLNEARACFGQRTQTDDPFYSFELARTHESRGGRFGDAFEGRVESHATAIQEASLLELGKVVKTHRSHKEESFYWGASNVIEVLETGVESARAGGTRMVPELKRREIELQEEYLLTHNQLALTALKKGRMHLSVSPAPHHSEMDVDVATELGYDGRLMLRERWLSEDELTMYQRSWMLFDVSLGSVALAAGELFDDDFGENSSLDIMQAFSSEKQHTLTEGLSLERFKKVLLGQIQNQQEDCAVRSQLNAFEDLELQKHLEEVAALYARELVEFEDALYWSVLDCVDPKVAIFAEQLLATADVLSEDERLIVKRAGLVSGAPSSISPDLFSLLWRRSYQSIQSRAAILVGNVNTLKESEHHHGAEFTSQLKEAERELMRLKLQGEGDAFYHQHEYVTQLMLEANLGCMGGCAIQVSGISEAVLMARAQGLEGTLYESMEPDEKLHCSCSKRMDVAKIYNGRVGMCSSCGSTTSKSSSRDQTVEGRKEDERKEFLWFMKSTPRRQQERKSKKTEQLKLFGVVW